MHKIQKNYIINVVFAGLVELVDTRDLKSLGWKRLCRFDSGARQKNAKLLLGIFYEGVLYVCVSKSSVGRACSSRRLCKIITDVNLLNTVEFIAQKNTNNQGKYGHTLV